MMMRFEKILPNGRLWATVYEGEETNTLDATFSQWEDVAWLKSFLKIIYQTYLLIFISQMSIRQYTIR